MKRLISPSALLALFAASSPVSAEAASMNDMFSQSGGIAIFALFLVLSYVLCRVWLRIVDWLMIEHEGLHSIEKRQPRTPSFLIIWSTLASTAALFLLSLKTITHLAPFNGPNGGTHAVTIFAIFAVLGIVIRIHWPNKSRPYAFAVMAGSVTTFLLIGIRAALRSGLADDPYLMALGTVSIVMLWRFLFGPWQPKIKATVLATFVFWMGLNMFFRAGASERMAHVMTLLIALLPAVVWCMLFLGYHRQRFGRVVLMFLSGMVSTAPVLFYDSLVRGGSDLNFFLFRIDPVSFSASSSSFVSGTMIGFSGIRGTLMATFISFLFVGLIEELSKFWVVKKSGQYVFSSIDDVMQLGIIAAIGFAFAENVLNPTYFLSFVREFLIKPDSPQWGAFMNNVMGRSVLTTMVHVLSTGVLSYFFALALFSGPYLQEETRSGHRFYLVSFMRSVFRMPAQTIFRRQMMFTGIVLAFVLHGAFNFIVTLPDILPGNPRTVGDVLGSADGSPFHFVSILLLPSLFYVVGGFWLLSTLFYKKECMKERGHVRLAEAFETDNVLAS